MPDKDKIDSSKESLPEAPRELFVALRKLVSTKQSRLVEDYIRNHPGVFFANVRPKISMEEMFTETSEIIERLNNDSGALMIIPYQGRLFAVPNPILTFQRSALRSVFPDLKSDEAFEAGQFTAVEISRNQKEDLVVAKNEKITKDDRTITTPETILSAREKRIAEIDAELMLLEEEIRELEILEKEALIEFEALKKEHETQETEPSIPESEVTIETERAEKMVETAVEAVEEENIGMIKKGLRELLKKTKDLNVKKRIGSLLKKAYKAATKTTKRKILTYTFLPFTVATPIALHYHTPEEYSEMTQNWTERHIFKHNKEDPKIKGVDALYNDQTDVQRTTYDFLGTEKINYKSGYYMTSVFDLTDHTPPKFKMINDRAYHSKIDNAAGITTNLFKQFCKFSEFQPQLKGHLDKKNTEERGEISVIAYNEKTQTMRAGSYKEFNEDWLVSETYSIPLNFKLNEDGTVNLMYHKECLRMVPESINENGDAVPFPIGVTADEKTKKINPAEATHFGTLEGGKVVMTCGSKQLQVNGSFADIFNVYQRLQKEFPGTPVEAYLLDNGSYNLPIWNKNANGEITPEMIKDHMLRNKDGGTALVLVNDGSISPYEYKNKYPEFEHHIEGYTLDPATGQPAKNEHSVIVIHHTGNYKDPQQIIREFEDPKKERSAHVLILKDGTRHLFNNDNYVLAHAGQSDFNDRNKVNFFSLGIEMEGDSQNTHDFTIAQLESMLEYMRPRVEKYQIPLENITTHKIIRDNYIKKHPDDKTVLTKTDLDDKVWEHVRTLIQKKLYAKEKPKVIGAATKLVGAIAYQDAYRVIRNSEQAFAKSMETLKASNASTKDINNARDWMKNFS